MQSALQRIDGRPYPAYRDVEGCEYDLGDCTLVIQHVQSDPFAPPSRCYVTVPRRLANFSIDIFGSLAVNKRQKYIDVAASQRL